MKFRPLDLISFSSFARGVAWNHVSSFFRPRQKWLTDKIPNTWCDKVELVPLVLFTILIDFVESEKGTDQLHIDWTEELEAGHVSQEYVDQVKTIYAELEAAYHYAKTSRQILLNRLDLSYPEPDLSKGIFGTKKSGTYEELYGETNRIEKEIADKDYWAMNIIVKHVGVLWT